MDIGIVTFHRANNYGAVLQAYALLTSVNKFKDCNVKIIDYKRVVEDKRYSPLFNLDKICKVPLFNVSRCLKFELFRLKYLPLTSKANSLLEFESQISQFDIGIWGSDQVWNKNIYDIKDEDVFFGKGIEIKKIAYAPSMGSCQIEKFNDNVNDLKSFHFITARDRTTSDNIKNLIKRDVSIVPDPVFLLSPTEWQRLFKRKKLFGEYIFYYQVGDDNSYGIAKKAAEQMKVPLVVVSSVCRYKDDLVKNVVGCGPIDLLQLIYNAKCVYTNSFHGAAFSIIFSKEFYCINLEKKGGNDRKTYLLKEFGLEDRMIKGRSIYHKNCGVIDYKEVREIYKKKRSYGLSKLKQMLYI